MSLIGWEHTRNSVHNPRILFYSHWFLILDAWGMSNTIRVFKKRASFDEASRMGFESPPRPLLTCSPGSHQKINLYRWCLTTECLTQDCPIARQSISVWQKLSHIYSFTGFHKPFDTSDRLDWCYQHVWLNCNGKHLKVILYLYLYLYCHSHFVPSHQHIIFRSQYMQM